jgi:hypothetical protein
MSKAPRQRAGQAFVATVAPGSARRYCLAAMSALWQPGESAEALALGHAIARPSPGCTEWIDCIRITSSARLSAVPRLGP